MQVEIQEWTFVDQVDRGLIGDQFCIQRPFPFAGDWQRLAIGILATPTDDWVATSPSASTWGVGIMKQSNQLATQSEHALGLFNRGSGRWARYSSSIDEYRWLAYMSAKIIVNGAENYVVDWTLDQCFSLTRNYRRGFLLEFNKIDNNIRFAEWFTSNVNTSDDMLFQALDTADWTQIKSMLDLYSARLMGFDFNNFDEQANGVCDCLFFQWICPGYPMRVLAAGIAKWA